MSDVTTEEALEILQRFVNAHFHHDDRTREQPRTSIPADREHDDDLRMAQFIK